MSKRQQVSATGKVRIELYHVLSIGDYGKDLRLSFTVYVRPRFFGSVRLFGQCSLNVVDDIVRVRDERTPGIDTTLSLFPRLAGGAPPAGQLSVSVLFFPVAERDQMDDFVHRMRQLYRNSNSSLPRVVPPTHESPAQAAAAAAAAAVAPSPSPSPSQAFMDHTPVICQLCHAETTREHALELDCLHVFCAPCLCAHVEKAIANPTCFEISCPLASTATAAKHVERNGDDDDDDVDDDASHSHRHSPMPCVLGQWAIRAVLPAARFDAFLEASLRLATSNSGAFFQCPAPECGTVMERLEPVPIDARERHEALMLSSAEERVAAARHKEQQRFRCRACRTEFCAECNAIPYHNNFTCASFKRFKESRRCRFCDAPMTRAPADDTPPALRLVCDAAACQAKAAQSCAAMLACGHACCGIVDEAPHLQCLQCDDPASGDPLGGEWCGICYVDALSAAPSIQLECGHVFHYECTVARLRNRWNGPVIAFQHLDCPLCAKPIKHASLTALLEPAHKFKDAVEAKANQRLVFEGLLGDDALTQASSRFYRKPVEYAMSRYAYYECHKCAQAYFGGMKSCQEARPDAHDPSELVCGNCSGAALGSALTRCEKHGDTFIAFKCQFCCAIAVWFCWGKTHFCDACHTKQRAGDYLSRKPVSAFETCGSIEKCPLHIEHPPNGTPVSICLGCAVCRQEASF